MADIQAEQATIQRMIYIYCKNKHGRSVGLCNECAEMLDYAHDKLNRCKFGNLKPACADCKIHCYKPLMRNKIREIMRFSGPRMLFYYPTDFFKHWFTKRTLPF